MYIQTRGLVVREVDYGESDKLLTVLTPEDGILTFRAAGVRKNKSSIKSACQLLCWSSFTAFQRSGKWSISEAEPIEMFMKLRQNIELLSLGMWFAQSAESVANADVPSPDVLRLLLLSLNALCKGRPQYLVKAAFEFRLTAMAGFSPNLEECCVCRSEFPDGLDIQNGALCCMNCGAGKQIVPIDRAVVEAFRYCLLCQLERLFSFTLPQKSLFLMYNAAEKFLLFQFGREFSSLDFYHSLESGPELAGM